ncbi:non-specific lipid-transfer protein 1-like [Solanum stenotomum]|uniref:non-specific lipid-transfer protein 1-like n=1 Tax=Solanum stenotomum TaxID=172797 RepID=UPI0020D058CF|nr:non-specific lipid-transfer protein 1-like [Solanum stenotomum]
MVKVALLVVMCIAAVGVMLTPNAEAIISCGQVVERLTPCIEYVREGGVLPTSCCSGIKTLNGEAATTPDRQAACNCIKSTAATISNINLDLAATLPTKCGVNLPYKISPSIDCSTVQ